MKGGCGEGGRKGGGIYKKNGNIFGGEQATRLSASRIGNGGGKNGQTEGDWMFDWKCREGLSSV